MTFINRMELIAQRVGASFASFSGLNKSCARARQWIRSVWSMWRRTIRRAAKSGHGGRLVQRDSISLGGRYYEIDVLHANPLLTLRIHEPWMDSVYSAVLKAKNGMFIDVGANIGQTMMKLLSLGMDRDYLGFEPQLDCSFFLERFIRKNRLNNFTIMPIGLSAKAGIAELLKPSERHDSKCSAIPGFRPDSFYVSKQEIYVAKGDDILASYVPSDVCVVKIDVEGGELEVLQGLVGTLVRFKPFIIFEVLNHYLAATREELDSSTITFRERRKDALEAILRNYGYRIFNILPGERLEEVQAIRPKVSADLSITDYIAIHQQFAEAFMKTYEGTMTALT